jgi:hypothetical protein
MYAPKKHPDTLDKVNLSLIHAAYHLALTVLDEGLKPYCVHLETSTQCGPSGIWSHRVLLEIDGTDKLVMVWFVPSGTSTFCLWTIWT